MTFSIMSKETAITRIVPAAAIPGGEIASSSTFSTAATPRVLIDGAEAHVVADSNQRVLALVPSIQGGEAQVTLSFDDGEPSMIAPSRLWSDEARGRHSCRRQSGIRSCGRNSVRDAFRISR